MSDAEEVFEVKLMTRVEGEGRFRVRLRDGVVTEAELSIFEAPRFFEAFLRGRPFTDVPDLVARICGICPVAHQLTSTRALERALGWAPSPALVKLRRLLYCGEWIESHALHVFLLHAPDFLGFPSALEMATEHRELVELGLGIRKAGNRLLEVLGGRAIHPVSPAVGGFTRVPTQAELRALLPELSRALEACDRAIDWAAQLAYPGGDQDYVFVSLGADTYPLESGETICVSGLDPFPLAEFEERFVERQVSYSTALQCRLADGRAYLTGPLARLAHHREKLHPHALAALGRSGLGARVANPSRSLLVRLIEIVHALAEARDLIDAYAAPTPARAELTPRAGVGHGATEAPRGLLYHRYAVDAAGLIETASIVPPTSQNQARIEEDLVAMGPLLATLPRADATVLCERLVRAYDPCISCSAHFLELDLASDEPLEPAPGAHAGPSREAR